MVSLSLAGGEPLSVTRITTEFVLGPCASVGVQVNTPLVELIDAPPGAPGSSEKVNICAGMSEPLALTVKVRSDPSVIVLFPIDVRTGAELVSVTIIVIVSKSPRAGEPLSVTRTVTVLVLGPCASVGVHVKTPLLELIVAPVGAPASKEKVKICAGMSGSVALAAKVRRVFSFTDCDPIGASTGALLTSLTTIVIVSKSLNAGEPLSVTRTVTELVLGPWASVGVHVNTPEPGLIDAPAGAPGSSEKIKLCAGMSGSVADAVNVSKVPSFTFRLPIGFKVGAPFTSVTVTVKLVASLKAGEPLSVTRTVITLVLGPCASDGVHENRPLLALIEAPLGAPGSRLNMSVCAGTSESVAEALNDSSAPSAIVRLLIAAMTGGLLDSSTMTVKL